MLILISR